MAERSSERNFAHISHALVGLLFAAASAPMVIMVRSVLQAHDESALPGVLKTADEAMMLGLYATLGVFLLLAARDAAA